MASTTVISSIRRSHGGVSGSLIVTGTVDDVTHHWRHSFPLQPYGPVEMTPAELAAKFTADQHALKAIQAALAELTVAVGRFDSLSTVDVVFAAGDEQAVPLGPDLIDVVATVGGVSTRCLFPKEEFMQLCSLGDGYYRLCQRLVQQADQNAVFNATNRDYIATFTVG